VGDHEPHVDAVAGLWVPATGVVDFGRVTEALADEVRTAGALLVLGAPVATITEHAHGVDVTTADGRWRAGVVVACGGVHADRLARMAGARTDLRIVPFRGEYHALVPDRSHLVRGLVYPVPDPTMPFLGVHLTRGIDGRVHVGPNAVLALGREAYTWRSSSARALTALVADPAVRAMARTHWRAGAIELARSASTRLLLRSAQRLVPDLRPGDLVRAGAGIRAQAVDADGRLVDDFAFATTSRTLHVLNAPSPAATASLAIGTDVARRLDGLGQDGGASERGG
jgi:L-2-hydroxyglutarate oxidase